MQRFEHASARCFDCFVPFYIPYDEAAIEDFGALEIPDWLLLDMAVSQQATPITRPNKVRHFVC